MLLYLHRIVLTTRKRIRIRRCTLQLSSESRISCNGCDRKIMTLKLRASLPELTSRPR